MLTAYSLKTVRSELEIGVTKEREGRKEQFLEKQREKERPKTERLPSYLSRLPIKASLRWGVDLHEIMKAQGDLLSTSAKEIRAKHNLAGTASPS